jgi:lysophospholipase L1-like esterase
MQAAITDPRMQPKTITDADIVIIHAGINNISNADKPTDICEEFHNLTHAIQGINSKAKVMISSVLPKKRDLLSTENISITNNLLKNMCTEKGFIFIDNDNIILKDGKVNQTLFYDEVHLNNEGSVVLGKQLNKAIRTSLGLQQNFSEKSVNFQKAQHHQKLDPNRRYKIRNRDIQTTPRFWPWNPWMHPKW